eukprot:11869565-Karenia_brevis.AAC.1
MNLFDELSALDKRASFVLFKCVVAHPAEVHVVKHDGHRLIEPEDILVSRYSVLEAFETGGGRRM